MKKLILAAALISLFVNPSLGNVTDKLLSSKAQLIEGEMLHIKAAVQSYIGNDNDILIDTTFTLSNPNNWTSRFLTIKHGFENSSLRGFMLPISLFLDAHSE